MADTFAETGDPYEVVIILKLYVVADSAQAAQDFCSDTVDEIGDISDTRTVPTMIESHVNRVSHAEYRAVYEADYGSTVEEDG